MVSQIEVVDHEEYDLEGRYLLIHEKEELIDSIALKGKKLFIGKLAKFKSDTHHNEWTEYNEFFVGYKTG
ncbi:MAG: hypothetical protein U5L96_04020 [Owenweeksia sp.]|nr:hypothetical protein [Owenweeksia sp.]